MHKVAEEHGEFALTQAVVVVMPVGAGEVEVRHGAAVAHVDRLRALPALVVLVAAEAVEHGLPGVSVGHETVTRVINSWLRPALR